MDWNASDESIKINCITSNPQDKVDHNQIQIRTFDYWSLDTNLYQSWDIIIDILKQI